MIPNFDSMQPAGKLLENIVTSNCEETPAPSLLARDCVEYSGQQILVVLASHILHCRLGKIVDYGS